jgi:hypothetical protein
MLTNQYIDGVLAKLWEAEKQLPSNLMFRVMATIQHLEGLKRDGNLPDAPTANQADQPAPNEFPAIMEINEAAGVLYVHSTQTGATILRLGGLPKPVPLPTPGNGLDIGFQGVEAHFNWRDEWRSCEQGG